MHFEHGRDYHRAVQYLQQAGENALRRWANHEAIQLLTKGLELLTTLPDTCERSQQELSLQTTLGPALIATMGYAAPDVAQTYARARDLCRRLGDTPQLFVALRGLQTFHAVRAELPMAAELAEELLCLAQRQPDPTLLVFAHLSLGSTLFHRGAFVQACVYLEQGTPLNIPQQEHDPAFLYGHGPGVVCISWAALALWLLGYPEQALQKGHEAITWARQLAQPFSLGGKGRAYGPPLYFEGTHCQLYHNQADGTFADVSRAAGIQVAFWPVLLGGQAMVWLAWPFERNGVLSAFVVTILACLLWRFRGGVEHYLRDISASVFTAAYVPMFASFAAMLVIPHDGVARVLCFLIAVVGVRRTRVTRYADAAAMDAYRTARGRYLASGKLLGALAAISIIAWIA